MRNNALDEIVRCNIDITSPSASSTLCDNVMIVVGKPAVEGTKPIDGVFAISKADDLLQYGYTVNEEAYIASTVAFSQSPTPNKLLVCVRQMTEEDAGTYENIQTTLNRVASEDFYGFHITEFKNVDDVNGAVQWAESNEKMFCFEYTDIDSFPVTNAPTSYYRTVAIFSGSAEGYTEDAQPKNNEYAALAWMVRCFGYEPGTESWHLKELTGIEPSALLTDEKDELEEKNINMFLRYFNNAVTIGGYTLAGEWIDVIRFRDWLKREMQNNVFHALRTTKKVPMTDNGIGMIECKMQETLLKGQSVGGICETEYDADGNEIAGFTVIVPKASELTAEEKKQRKLTSCMFSARLLGAIHLTELHGTLTN